MKIFLKTLIAAIILCLAVGKVSAAVNNQPLEQDKELAPLGVNTNKVLAKQERIRREYLGIFLGFLKGDKSRGWNMYVKEVTIKRYKRFLQKYPDSSFAPEAKLRIAEFYDLVFQRPKAKKWLDDIIKNHPDDGYHTIRRIAFIKEGKKYSRYDIMPLPGTKTAAWALYWRALWFPENRDKDIERILTDFKESSKVVALTKRLLEKSKKRGF